MLRIGSTRSAVLVSSKVTPASKRSISSLSRSSIAVPNHRLPVIRDTSATARTRLLFNLHQAPYATKTPSGFQKGIDFEEEKKLGQRKLEPHPESVTTDSSVRHVYEPADQPTAQPVGDGLVDDLKLVQDTFSLSNAPKEPYWLGLAGTLPYLGTSVSTVYLAWVLNTEWPTSSAIANNLLISPETASWLLATLEPIQLGYGAVIISFLGAVHWGMEYAEKAPKLDRTRFRYGLGVMAPIVAWPTLFMPVEFALTGQFAAFVGLYFADARATVRGWAPVWYSTYRFALTAVVGVAIAISLIGRAKVGDASPRLTGLREKFHERRGEQDFTQKWQDLEKQDIAKAKKAEKEAQAEKEKQKAKEKKSKSKGDSKGDKNDKQSGGAKGEDSDEKKDGEESKNENAEKSEDEDTEESDEDDGEKDGDKNEEENDKKDDDKGAKKGDEKDEKSKDKSDKSNESEEKGDGKDDEKGDKKKGGKK